MSTITVIKRDGTRSPIDFSKINSVVINACKGLKNVSASELISKAKILFVDGVTTEHVQSTLIKTAADLISIDAPDWSYVCARLNVYDIRKRAYGSYNVPHLIDCIQVGVDKGYYDKTLLENYTASEMDIFNDVLDHERDNTFTAAAMGQLGDKYLLRNRTKGDRAFYESPQIMYMLIAMTLFSVFPSSRKRVKNIISFYNNATTFKFSLPTPIMSAARTPTRQFSSCVLIKCGDTLDSINATATAITKYISKKAGIGVDQSMIRSEGAPIRKGEMTHTGVIPFLKYHVAAVKSCSQGGIRGGSATMYYAWWHYQFDDIVVLKNNRGVEENRERRCDYGIQINGELFRRYFENEDVWLLDPSDTPDLYKAFFDDQGVFQELYAHYCKKAEAGLIRGKKLTAEEVLNKLIQQRSETGRIYIAFVDNMNEQGPFNKYIDPLTMSNLCLEIALPVRQFEDQYDENGRIALCTLSSVNMLEVKSFEEKLEVAECLVWALNGLLRYQEYPMIQAKLATEDFATLGVGVVNYAAALAELGFKYGDENSLKYTNQYFEELAYALTKASVDFAKEFNPCGRWKDTCYGKGVFPHEKAHPGVYQLVSYSRHLEEKWDELREELLNHGIANATLMAVAPTESSSQVLNATNGIEPPMEPVTIKASKSGLFKQIIPNPHLIDNYNFAWSTKTRDYLNVMAVIQRWVDQSISSNTTYDPDQFEDGKLPAELVLEDIIDFYTKGGKTLYYSKLKDGAGEEKDVVVKAKPQEPDDSVCESCVI
ncbi:ribonucleoside-diphosphate reductase [Vibrio phage vB_VchM_Kuja]|uniref:Ribonucleoside-diphosphate reductase n=1 Tax=Vibrio phage vB_VchM_Kuja TaxID=2686437 RepID=A0A6B9J5D1_9CAUD|nr:ribonucleotide reductase large subunit [Vibrio phage vB_VchM_Kuja]QGZ16015.1 ribonucleoside-diphosphate reductase [Vibrio phage vB_VchM_Kuja]